VQEIRNYQDGNVEGRHLEVHCTASANCNLLLNGAVDLRSFASIPLVIMVGQPTEKQLARLSKQALGGIFGEDLNFVFGWFYLKNSDSYAAVWDQVRDGGYLDCNIQLGVSPVRLDMPDTWIWDARHPLSIETVSLRFTRKSNKPGDQTTSDQTSPRTGLFGRRAR
jgi:hypothetical protein